MDPTDPGSADTHASQPKGEASGIGEGKTVGRYVLGKMLGHGGMGLVFVAEDPQLKRKVALKLMRSAAPDPEHLQRFEREAQAMARLSHRNVVAVYDFGVDDGQPYLVMELIHGVSLREWVKTPRHWEKVLEVIVDAAHGLEAAHAAGLVHRDFKPENVLVGDDGRVAVTDFGIARLQETAPNPLTAPQAFIGTPGYIAPEQLSGRGVEARSDQFALGITLHECLTGAHPFAPRHATPAATGGPPRYLLDIAARAMRPIPEERFGTIREFLAAIEKKESPAALPRRPWALIAGLVGLGVLLPLVGYLGTRAATPVAEVPVSSIPSAVAAFDEGVQLLLEGSTAPAVRRLRAAVADDAQLAMAHLWLALIDADPASARESFARAQLNKARLRPENVVVLEALAPGMTPLPDFDAWLKVVQEKRRGAQRHHLLWLLEATIQLRLGEIDAANAALDQVAQLHPSFATLALAWRGRFERERNDPAAAIAAWTKCLQRSPRATDCLSGRARQQGLAGDCDAMAKDARAWAVADPSDGDAQLVLANAFQAQGLAWASVEEALKARWEKLSPQVRARTQWYDEVNFAAMRGDFALARERAQAQVDAVPSSAGFLEHYLPNFTLLLVLREMGELEAAGKVAQGFLERVPAWQVETTREAALVLLFVREAHRAGYMDEATFVAQRARWLKVVDDTIAKGRRTDAYSKSIAWVVGYAAGARSKEDGVEAMRELPRYQPLPPPGARGTDIDLVIGVVYALADQPALALPRVETVAKSCYRLENPFAWVYGMHWKGQVLEALGKKAEAAEAFGAVTKTWGGARPKSVMAERAQKHLEGLR